MCKYFPAAPRVPRPHLGWVELVFRPYSADWSTDIPIRWAFGTAVVVIWVDATWCSDQAAPKRSAGIPVRPPCNLVFHTGWVEIWAPGPQLGGWVCGSG